MFVTRIGSAVGGGGKVGTNVSVGVRVGIKVSVGVRVGERVPVGEEVGETVGETARIGRSVGGESKANVIVAGAGAARIPSKRDGTNRPTETTAHMAQITIKALTDAMTTPALLFGAGGATTGSVFSDSLKV